MQRFYLRILTPLLLLALFLLAGCAQEPGGTNPAAPPTTQGEGETTTQTINLYYPDPQTENLIAVPIQLEKADDLEMLTLKALIAGEKVPAQGSNPFPQGLEVKEMTYKDGRVTIDFNEALYQIQGSAGERMALNSLLKTLGQFPEFKTLRLSVNGEKVETLGHYDLTEPLPFDKTL